MNSLFLSCYSSRFSKYDQGKIYLLNLYIAFSNNIREIFNTSVLPAQKGDLIGAL